MSSPGTTRNTKLSISVLFGGSLLIKGEKKSASTIEIGSMEIVFNCYEISCDKGELFDKVRKVLDFAGLKGSLQDYSQVNITVKMP
ncbi:MAG: hypothetical protein WCF23_00845 [Candidatus Nitrosopolaris sp.]